MILRLFLYFSLLNEEVFILRIKNIGKEELGVIY